MPTPTGTISMSDVNVELGNASTALISLNDPAVRDLAGVASGTISMDDLRGKSNELGWQLEGFKGQTFYSGFGDSLRGRMNFNTDGTAQWVEPQMEDDDYIREVVPPIFDHSTASPGVGAVIELRLTRLSGNAPTTTNMPNGTWVRVDVARYFEYTQAPKLGVFRLELRGYFTGVTIDTAEFTARIV